jgi:hypothetical protein
MYTPDQIRECLTTQYGYSLDSIPISFGGSFDPVLDGDTRCENCLLIVKNPQSICYPYYSADCQPATTKPTRNILFFNTEHQDGKKSIVSSSTTTTTNSQASLVAIVALRRHHDSSSQIRVRKRESSTSSSDSEKRRRSNDSLIEEEPRVVTSLTYIPTEIFTE